MSWWKAIYIFWQTLVVLYSNLFLSLYADEGINRNSIGAEGDNCLKISNEPTQPFPEIGGLRQLSDNRVEDHCQHAVFCLLQASLTEGANIHISPGRHQVCEIDS